MNIEIQVKMINGTIRNINLYTNQSSAERHMSAEDAADLFTDHSQETGFPFTKYLSSNCDKPDSLVVAAPLHEMDAEPLRLYEMIKDYASDVELVVGHRMPEGVEVNVWSGAAIACRFAILNAMIIHLGDKLDPAKVNWGYDVMAVAYAQTVKRILSSQDEAYVELRKAVLSDK